jgi:hypothetical protein
MDGTVSVLFLLATTVPELTTGALIPDGSSSDWLNIRLLVLTAGALIPDGFITRDLLETTVPLIAGAGIPVGSIEFMRPTVGVGTALAAIPTGFIVRK